MTVCGMYGYLAVTGIHTVVVISENHQVFTE